jgi:hypothetical protein
MGLFFGEFMKFHYEKIVCSLPVDRNAVNAIRGGVSFKGKNRVLTSDSDYPISVRKVPKGSKDLTGIKFGRFTVIGLKKKQRWFSGVKKKKWVVRCVCGIFSVRLGKSILNSRNYFDRCEFCRYSAFLKREDFRKNYGDSFLIGKTFLEIF